ncbi:hypothetical protein D3C86_1216350 [compost metagenome]
MCSGPIGHHAKSWKNKGSANFRPFKTIQSVFNPNSYLFTRHFNMVGMWYCIVNVPCDTSIGLYGPSIDLFWQSNTLLSVA